MKNNQTIDVLIEGLHSLMIDGEKFYITEGDILQTEDELRSIPETQLRYYLLCQQANDNHIEDIQSE